jgi:parallel beta helix pectate lyase-like protein/copper-binding protein NosD
MRRFLDSFRRRPGNKGSSVSPSRSRRSLRLEPLEERQLLTVVVDSAADDTIAGDGLTTLREALAIADSNPGPDVITFDSTALGTAPTITLGGSELSIISDVEINGVDASDPLNPIDVDVTIDADSNSRIFRIGSYSDVTLSGLTLTGGDYSTWCGGAIYAKYTDLTLDGVEITDSQALYGGAIFAYTEADVTLRGGTRLHHNEAINRGGGVYQSGSTSSVTIEDATVDTNTAGDLGGGVAVRHGATLTLRSPANVDNNTATAGSPNIYVDGISTVDVPLVVDSPADTVADDGVTTLREAITLADSLPGPNVIFFDSAAIGPAHTITLDGNELSIISDMEISGFDVADPLNPIDVNITIDANNNSRVFRIGNYSDVTLSGLTLTGGNNSSGGAIYAKRTDLTLDGVEITDNQAKYGSAIFAYTDTDVTLSGGTRLHHNTATRFGGAVYAYGSTGTLTVEDATIDSNDATSRGGGIAARRGGSLVLNADALVFGNTTDSFKNPNIYVTADSNLTDNRSLALYVDGDAPGAGAGTGTSADPFKYLQDALEIAYELNTYTAGTVEEISVAEGTYTPYSGVALPGPLADRARLSNFSLVSGVSVIGGYDSLGDVDSDGGETILSGELGTPSAVDNSYSVVIGAGVSGAALKNVTVSGGYADGAVVPLADLLDYWDDDGNLVETDLEIDLSYGGGVNLVRSSVILENVQIKNNAADTGGGGLAVTESWVGVTNSGFFQNDSFLGGGMYVGSESYASVSTSWFAENGNSSSYGGGIFIDPGYVAGSLTIPAGTASFSESLADSNYGVAGYENIYLPDAPNNEGGGWPGLQTGNTVPLAPTVFVDDDWAGKVDGEWFLEDLDPSVPGREWYKFGVSAFADIQDGIDGVSSGGTVNVLAGLYEVDSYTTSANGNRGGYVIDKPLTLAGAGAAADDSSTSSIVSLDASITSSVYAVYVDGLNQLVDGVTISGFRFDGDPEGTGANDLLRGVMAAGNSVATGWESVGVSNLTVEDNYFVDMGRGVVVRGNVEDIVVNENTFTGIGSWYAIGMSTGYWPEPESLAWAMDGIEVTDNTITDSTAVPIRISNYRMNRGATMNDVLIDGNVITNIGTPVFADAYAGAIGSWGDITDLVISDNSITNVQDMHGISISAYDYSLPGYAGSYDGLAITENAIDGVLGSSTVLGDTIPAAGIMLQNGHGDGTFASGVTIDSTNSVSNAGIGVYIAAESVTLDGVTLTDNTTGVQVSRMGNATITGNTPISGGDTGLLVDGADASVEFTGATPATFAGQTDYITLDNGAMAGEMIDATGVVFDGDTGATASLAKLFDIEDKITHAVDDNSLGVVYVKADNLYVTAGSSIQSAINVANTDGDRDTVNVEAGAYAEDVTIGKELSLIGPNAGIDPNTGSRVAEANITGSSGATEFLAVTADNVTIDGFTIDGTAVPDMHAITGDAISNALIANNIIRDLGDGRGVVLTGASTTNSTVRNNLITDVDTAVDFHSNAYADVIDNVIDDVRNGILAYSVNNAFTATIQGNEIGARSTGMYMTNNDGQISLVIDDNEVSAASGATGYWIGIRLLSINGDNTPIISDNIIDGAGLDPSVDSSGIRVWRSYNNGADISGGSITNVDVGIAVSDTNPSYGSNSATTTATIDDVAISDAEIGILVEGTTGTSSATITNTTTITGGTTGVLVDGANASVVFQAASPAAGISGQSGDYITLANGAMAGQAIDATSLILGGVDMAGSPTLAELFAIEDKITHGVDDTSLGVVYVQSDNLYVTDSGVIQNALDVANTDGTVGDTVTVEAGTYNENLNIAAPLTLVSADGDGATTIQGSLAQSTALGGGNLGTVCVFTDGVVIGTDGSDGFEIIGYDYVPWNNEHAAVYYKAAATSGLRLIGNTITADGEAAILTEYGGLMTDFEIGYNEIGGITFAGPTAGSSWNVDNGPRSLVYISGPKTGIEFHHNTVDGIVGGEVTGAPGTYYYNTGATIDCNAATSLAEGANIHDNTFAVNSWAALRARGPYSTLTDNTFDFSEIDPSSIGNGAQMGVYITNTGDDIQTNHRYLGTSDSEYAGGSALLDETFVMEAGVNLADVSLYVDASGFIYVVGPTSIDVLWQIDEIEFADHTISTGTITDGLLDVITVDDDWTGTAEGGVVDTGSAYAIYGVNAFDTIQEGIDAVNASGSVQVFAGTYPETVTATADNITIDGVANSSPLFFPPEAPGLSGQTVQKWAVVADPALGTYVTGGLDLSGSTGVTVRDMAFTGQIGNGVIKSYATDVTFDGILVDGEDTAGRHGTYGAYSGDLSVTNSEFRNVLGWSLFDSNSGGSPSLTGTAVFEGNYIHDSSGSVAIRGDSGVSASITGNVWENLGTAAGDEYWAAVEVNRIATVDISDNRFDGFADTDNAWDPPQGIQAWNIDTLTVTGNYMDMSGTTTDASQGMWLAGGLVSATVDDNVIDGATGIGIYVTETTGANTAITIDSGNTISNSVVGVEVAAGPTTIAGATLTDNTTGIKVTGSGDVTITAGATITGGDVGVQVDGAGASVTFLGASTAATITGQGTYYIELLNGAMDNETRNIEDVVFDSGIGLTTLEDRLWHAVDDPSLGQLVYDLTAWPVDKVFAGMLTAADGTLDTPDEVVWLDMDGDGTLDQAAFYQRTGFSTINAAIAGVEETGTVNVAPETFTESVKINKSLTLLGHANASTSAKPQIIGATGDSSVVQITAGSTVLDGFDISGSVDSTYGVMVNDPAGGATISGVTVQNNNIHGITAGITTGSGLDYGIGILVNGHNNLSGVTLDDNTISAIGTGTVYGAGISLEQVDGVTVTGSTISSLNGLPGAYGVGILVEDTASNVDIGGTGTENTYGAGIDVAIANAAADTAIDEGTFTADPTVAYVVDATGSATVSLSPQHAMLTNVDSSFALLGGTGAGYKVYTPLIQTAIDMADSGGTSTIDVTADTFAEAIDIDKSVTLTGVAGSTTLDLTGIGGNAVDILTDGTTVVIEGLDIQNAQSMGVYVAPAADVDVTLRNSTITDSASSGFRVDGNDTVLLDSVTLTDNNANGISNAHDLSFFQYHGDATLTDVTVNASNTGGHAVQIAGYYPSNPDPEELASVAEAETFGLMDIGTVNINGLTLTGSAKKTGLVIQAYSELDGLTFTGATPFDSSTFDAGWSDLALQGFDPTETIALGTSKLQTLALWYRATTNVDATSVTFYEVGGGALDTGILADNFTIEDQVFHGMDADNLGLVTWNTGHYYVTGTDADPADGLADMSIQQAIDEVAATSTIHVEAGTFAERLTVDNSVTLLGANAGIHPAVGTSTTETVGTRVAETILELPSIGLLPQADNITVDGFTLQGTGGRIIDTYADADNFAFRNNIYETDGGASGQGSMQFGGGSHTNSTFEFNHFVQEGDASLLYTAGDFDGLTFQNNYVSAAGDAIFWTADQLDGGVITENEFDGSGVPGGGYSTINIGKGGDLEISDNHFHDMIYTPIQVGLDGGSITGNLFEDIAPYPGYFGDAIELWGGQWGTTVSTNVQISGNTIHFNNDATLPIHGIRLRSADPGDPQIDGSTIHVYDNTFIDDGALPLGQAFAIRNQAGGFVDADQNLYVDSLGNPITSVADLAPRFNDQVDFSDWYTDLAMTTTSGVTLSYYTGTNPVYVDGGWAAFTVDDTNVLLTGTTDEIVYMGHNAFATIQAAVAVDAVSSGGTVLVQPGTYTEQVTITQPVIIEGSGSGAGAGDTIITADATVTGESKEGVIQFSSDVDGVILRDLRVSPDGIAGISVGRFTEGQGVTVESLELDNVAVVGTSPTSPASEQERGLYVDLTSTIDGLTITDSAFDNLMYGWYLQKSVSADTSTVTDVSVSDTSFSNNNHKGLYAEKLDDALFDNITVEDNASDTDYSAVSYFAPWGAGVDINLKAGTYADIAIVDSTFDNNATDTEVTKGGALLIKARNDGATYGAFPATLDGVAITGNTFSNNERGIAMGEVGKNNVNTNVVINGNSFLNNVAGTQAVAATGSIINHSTSDIDANFNWFDTASVTGGTAVSTVQGEVNDVNTGTTDYDLWLGDASQVGTTASTWKDDLWTDASTSGGLQTALDTVSDGGTLHLTDGTYSGNLTVTDKSLTLVAEGTAQESVVLKPVVAGGLVDTALTITDTNNSDGIDTRVTIDGQGTLTFDGDALGRSVLIDGEDASLYGVGFRVTNGYTSQSSAATVEEYGAGIHNDGGTLYLANVVMDNNVDAAGGAIFQTGGTAIGNLTNVTISKNTATLGGGMTIDEGTMTINNSLILGNSAFFGADIAINSGATLVGSNNLVNTVYEEAGATTTGFSYSTAVVDDVFANLSSGTYSDLDDFRLDAIVATNPAEDQGNKNALDLALDAILADYDALTDEPFDFDGDLRDGDGDGNIDLGAFERE